MANDVFEMEWFAQQSIDCAFLCTNILCYHVFLYICMHVLYDLYVVGHGSSQSRVGLWLPESKPLTSPVRWCKWWILLLSMFCFQWMHTYIYIYLTLHIYDKNGPICWLLKASYISSKNIVNWNFENPRVVLMSALPGIGKARHWRRGKGDFQSHLMTFSNSETLRENGRWSNLNMFQMGGWNHHLCEQRGFGKGLSFFLNEFRSEGAPEMETNMNKTNEWSYQMIGHWRVFNTWGLV